MRLSRLFFKTFKEAPAEADILSHKLLERAGFIKKLGRGLYTYTPLMWRVIQKLSTVIREEMNAAGAQEVHMPHLHPAEIWKKSGRWDGYRAEGLLFALEDREGAEYALGPTHEEVITHLVTDWLSSYKQLPVNLYQITHKFRDEIRPRFGLMRCKEFLMKDAYAFCQNEEQMQSQYDAMHTAYTRILERLGLDFATVKADGGKIGKGKSEEFQVLADVGEDALLIAGDLAYNVEAAEALLKDPIPEAALPLKEVSTPGISTIEELVAFLGVEAPKIVKTLIYKLTFKDKEEFVAIGIRGDRSINEVKVANFFGALQTELATIEEIYKITKSPQGFAGPIDCPLVYYADNSIKALNNFVTARNKKDLHLLNVSWGRDVTPKGFHDFLLAEAHDICPHNNEPYIMRRGIEVGHVFNLGTRYSEACEAYFQDENGKSRPFHMGCYGIGVGRLAAACIEQKGDSKGLVWPLCIAPYKVFITAAKMNEMAMKDEAERLYTLLGDALLDDREERLGFKLKDCDLLGIPYKVIVGNRFIEEGLYELESRQGEKEFVSEETLLKKLHQKT